MLLACKLLESKIRATLAASSEDDSDISGDFLHGEDVPEAELLHLDDHPLITLDDDGPDNSDALGSGVSTLTTKFEVSVHAQFRCLAHSLQNCMKTAIDLPENSYIKLLVVQARKINAIFRKRPHMSDHLKARVGKGVVPDVETRWNSTIDSLVRLCQVLCHVVLLSYKALSWICHCLRPSFFAFVPQPEVYQGVVSVLSYEHKYGRNKNLLPDTPTAEEYVLYQKLIRVLAPFSIATDRLQSAGITSPLVLPELSQAMYGT